ncbi:hypothetical protein AZA_47508 [Nitrospirillum viridazoti Y2]|nr:hypothetical protein AZA_47508 [Nitrospirillum amazonense Y2]
MAPMVLKLEPMMAVRAEMVPLLSKVPMLPTPMPMVSLSITPLLSSRPIPRLLGDEMPTAVPVSVPLLAKVPSVPFR